MVLAVECLHLWPFVTQNCDIKIGHSLELAERIPVNSEASVYLYTEYTITGELPRDTSTFGAEL
jgi:hypothetical protein